MRLQVIGGDVYEVERTHLTNKFSDIGTTFCDFVKGLCSTSKSTFAWSDEFLDYSCVAFKSMGGNDIFEVLILTEKKEDALAIVQEMFNNGCYDATDNNAVIITTEDWSKYLNM